jgi:formylglycine-generating enzyme required for sulfatase activity
MANVHYSERLARYIETVWAALQKIWKHFSDDNPDQIAPHFKPKQPFQSPSPFAWIDIPAGKVEIEGQGEFSLPAFQISKYPITNAQFAPFIEAGGYSNAQFWTEAGWQQKENGKWIEPHYWNDAKWNGAEYPVVGVSWYEAMAYCSWLSAETGDTILLPTEQQWQRAAQGDDGRIYPWGNDWVANRCNHSIGKDWREGQTSPVQYYEGNGASYFKVVDMAGNVNEWTLVEVQPAQNNDPMNPLVWLTGSSWINNDKSDLLIANRGWSIPSARTSTRGFRPIRVH